MFRPFRAQGSPSDPIPGRCPGLICGGPFGATDNDAGVDATVSAIVAFPGRKSTHAGAPGIRPRPARHRGGAGRCAAGWSRRSGSARAGCAGGDREYVSFSCNDYLGLTHHPAVIAAAREAIERYGTGAGASRLVTGSHPLYRRARIAPRRDERHRAGTRLQQRLHGECRGDPGPRRSRATSSWPIGSATPASWDGARLSGATVDAVRPQRRRLIAASCWRRIAAVSDDA